MDVLPMEYRQIGYKDASAVYAMACYPEPYILTVWVLRRAPFVDEVCETPEANEEDDEGVPKSIYDPYEHE